MVFEFKPLLFRASTSWTVQGGNLLADNGILRSLFDIDIGPVSVILRHVGIGKNCFYGTFGNTCVAIDASVGINVKTIGQFMKSFNRTYGCAVGVLAIDA